MGPELALAGSAREWPDRLHRFLLDHGGGRVRARVMGPQQAMTEDYDVLLIDDVCSYLTPRLVRGIRESGREVIGVFDPEDGPDAKRHLLECGITDVIESGASPEEFLLTASSTISHRTAPDPKAAVTTSSHRVGVVGVPGGVGTTEVALGLAMSLSDRRPTVLVDLDREAPGLAQRLDLPPHPNLLTAVDAAHHARADLGDSLLSRDSLKVVGGLVGRHPSDSIHPVEIEGLLDELAQIGFDMQVADLGRMSGSSIEPLGFRIRILVGSATPVGIGRLVRAWREVKNDGPTDTVAVINRVAPGAGRRIEIKAETIRLMPGLPVVLLPEDRRLDRAAWDGSYPGRGPFARAMRKVAELIDGSIS